MTRSTGPGDDLAAAGDGCPRSATSFGLSLAALLVGLGLIGVLAPWSAWQVPSWVPYAPLIPCVGIVLVIGVAQALWPQRLLAAPTPYPGPVQRPLDLKRVGLRIVGLTVTLGLVALAYGLFPEYHGDFYQPYWQFLETLAPLTVLIPFYFLWADRHAREVQDEYHEMGRALLGGWRTVDRARLRRHLLSWTVKAFFLPLMVVYLGNEIRALFHAWQALQPRTLEIYQVFYHLSYTVDLLFCVVGYTATIRLFDAHIRSVEPTVAGWVIALICYQPFYSVIGRFYLQYDDSLFWDNWLQPWPALRSVWAVAIVLLALIYALSTVAFGLRFSNLTYRGIITSGPYRFSKHPAYLSKNLSWWLISVPFISVEGWSTAAQNCALLALLNLVYYLRARTEERHLSIDPTYVQYALWMNEHGLLRRLGRLLPGLQYRPPASAAVQPAPAAVPPAPPIRRVR